MSFKISLKNHQETQAICVLGMLGSVSAGKTSLCEKLAKNKIPKTKEESINQSTRRVGYINIKIYGDSNNNYLLNPTIIPSNYKLLRHFSMADNPGHNSLMTTLIAGTAPINVALLVISCNEGIAPQTYQHIKCFKCTEITDISIIISKLDLAKTKEQLYELIDKIDTFMNEELDENLDPPIIPLSSFDGTNMNQLIKFLLSRNYSNIIASTIKEEFNMNIIRSFDINKPGTKINCLKGAVIGGSIKTGYLTKGDVILILPGIINKNKDIIEYTPLLTQVVNLQSNEFNMEVVIPGGFIAIETTLDSSLSKANNLSGNIIKKINSLDDISLYALKCYNSIFINNIVYLINDYELIEKEKYILALHGLCHCATFNDKNNMHFIIDAPFYIKDNDKIAILKKQNNNTIIIGYANIINTEVLSNLQLKYQEDYIYFYENLPLKKEITSIEFINDLDEECIENYKILDVDTLINELKFRQIEFNIKCNSINLSLNTTSFTITNASEIFKNFSSDTDIIIEKSTKFSEFIKEQYKSELNNSIVIVDNNAITFRNVKRALRKFFITDLNKHLEAFIIRDFTCLTCKCVGSMMYEKKYHICRSCNAIAMEKK